MLQKIAKPPSRGLLRSGFKAFILFETLLFFGSWVGWQRLRSSRSFIVDKSSHIYWKNIIHLKNTPPLNLRIELWTRISGERKGNCLNDPLFSMAFVKTVLWLVGGGGLAYVLLETLTPKDLDIRKFSADSQLPRRTDRTERAIFLENLKRITHENRSKNKEEHTSSTQNSVEK